MVISQYRSRRTSSGALYRDFRKKKQFEAGNEPTHTGVGVTKSKIIRGMGGKLRYNLMQAEFVNVMDKKTKKCFKAKITTVKANPAR
jgi:ribosomal protein S8E